MSEFDTVSVLWGIGALVLVVSALSIRRVKLGFAVKSLLIWAVIVLVLFLVIDRRHELGLAARGGLERLGIAEQSVVGDTVRIRRSSDGHYWASVTINGVDKRLLVDSGATYTVVSEETAAQAGIAVDTTRLPIVLLTANGAVSARRGRVRELVIGNLSMRDVAVVVLPGQGDLNVIGMNVLSRLHSWRVEGGVLVLEPSRAESATPATASGSIVDS